MRIKKLYWTDIETGKSKRAICALHDRPLFKINNYKYRCSKQNCGATQT